MTAFGSKARDKISIDHESNIELHKQTRLLKESFKFIWIKNVKYLYIKMKKVKRVLSGRVMILKPEEFE